jgi:hypothetical protein
MTIEMDLHLTEDRCAELVLGLAGASEREAAIAHAERCEACAVRLRAHVAAQARMLADQPAPLSAGAPRAIRRIPRLGYWLPAAAALAVVSVLLARSLAPPVPAPASRWLPALGEPQLLRGAAPADPHLAAGLRAYAARDLATAARELASARAEGPAEQARRVYLAHAWLELGEPERALPLLRSVNFAELPAAVSREAAGLLAHALRATGHGAEADSLERLLQRTPEWVPVRP